MNTRVYLPVSQSAQSLSVALWSLSRPAGLRVQQDTQYLFPWATAVDGSQWLEVDVSYEINVHPQADATQLAAILQPWADADNLMAEPNVQLEAMVDSNRGGKLTAWSVFPQALKDLAKTRQQMIDAGLLEQPPTEGGA